MLKAFTNYELVDGCIQPNIFTTVSSGALLLHFQELRLLSHVFDTAASGDAEGVCDAIERFGEDVLNPAGQWLKVP